MIARRPACGRGRAGGAGTGGRRRRIGTGSQPAADQLERKAKASRGRGEGAGTFFESVRIGSSATVAVGTSRARRVAAVQSRLGAAP